MSASSYFFLSDLSEKVRIKIGSVKGHRLMDDVLRLTNFQPHALTGESELYVTCQIYSNGLPLGLAASTSYRCFPSSNRIGWGEWLTFPVKYRDLSPTSRIVLTVWSIQPIATPVAPSAASASGTALTFPELTTVPLGGTCLPLFSKKGILKLGRRKLFLWPGVEGDGSIHSRTPSKTSRSEGFERLHKNIRKYDQKELPYSWLDKLTLRRIESMQQREVSSDPSFADEGKMHLSVEFPAFRHPVVFHQKPCNPPLPEIAPFKDKQRIFVLHDPETRRENPIEAKFKKLARGSKGLADRDLKPTLPERKELQAIVESPNKRMTQDQKNMLWRFRFSLVDSKQALTKFLRCLDWNDANETKQALELMAAWAPIDTADALELLSSDFKNKDVRIYAVKQLAKADDEELGTYLLQLVQALRYEPGRYPSYLSEFLINRATHAFSLCNFFHWFLMVEKQDKTMGSLFSRVHEDFMEVLVKSPEGVEWEKILAAEGKLINQLIALGDNAKAKGGKVEKKKERLKASLAADGEFKELRVFAEPVRIPVRPDVVVTGLTEDSSMFTSALAPIRAHFSTPEEKKQYIVIFKSGDDLRQDQLVIQLINLMDSLMKKVRLDLQLTPYRVLATAPNNGFVEFVHNSHTLTEVLDDHGKDIMRFLSKHNPKPAAQQKALDNFVRSTAGYCVITYILGVGDRHMENLMLTKDGHLFHIDFGWLFGRDPKPFPPPIKFCKEMVLAMGGADSASYTEFRRCAQAAFQILRQNANLILNLLHLMADAGIPHLSGDVEATIFKVQEKFRLDLGSEEADRFILGLIDNSMNALFPKVIDTVHKWAMYWK